MKSVKTQKGISLIEVLIALGVFAVSFSAIVFLLLDATRSSGHTLIYTQATTLAQEGIEASRSIANNDFDDLVFGTHGAALSGGVWTFSGAQDSEDVFTRSITVTDVSPGVKDVVSEVTWEDSYARQKSSRITSRMTDWRGTQGDAGGLDVGISGAVLTSSSTVLSGIELKNTTATDTVIDKMIVRWNGGGGVYGIRIGGVDVFAVPSENGVVSGGEIDIGNYMLTAGAGTTTVEAMSFSGPVSGNTLTVSFIMADGSISRNLVPF